MKEFNLEYNENNPLIGMVGRLTHQKGIDLVTSGIERILNTGASLFILGTGDKHYEGVLKSLEEKYPNRLRVVLEFSFSLAQKIYAASDLFLMPSKFEPCGLSQLIALRYGSLPIVNEVGGLKDTIIPFDHTKGEGYGFTFKTYNVEDLVYAVERAVGLYRDYKTEFMKALKNGMEKDFGWDSISKNYVDLYKKLM
jgi:starch synthase